MNKVIKAIRYGTFYRKVKMRIRDCIYRTNSKMTDEEFLIQKGKSRLGYTMDLKNPKTLAEKVNWYKLHYHNDLMPICADKDRVAEYVKSKGLEHILVKRYGVYDRLEDIDLSTLPDQFVAKATGDSGGVVVCRDKSTFFKTAKEKIKIDSDYSDRNKEWPYHYIKNRIIVEDLIQTEDGDCPKDYKFFCFYGEPKFLFVGVERQTCLKMNYYDLEWNRIPVRRLYPNTKRVIEKPKKLDEMLEICRILSKDFPHVRVDLYYENNQIYFGELTFFPSSGFEPFKPRKYDRIFGEYFDITKINPEDMR